MNRSFTAIPSTDFVANGHDLLYMAAAGMFIALVLNAAKQVTVSIGELVRLASTVAMVVLSAGAALALLVVITVGGL